MPWTHDGQPDDAAPLTRIPDDVALDRLLSHPMLGLADVQVHDVAGGVVGSVIEAHGADDNVRAVHDLGCFRFANADTIRLALGRDLDLRRREHPKEVSWQPAARLPELQADDLAGAVGDRPARPTLVARPLTMTIEQGQLDISAREAKLLHLVKPVSRPANGAWICRHSRQE